MVLLPVMFELRVCWPDGAAGSVHVLLHVLRHPGPVVAVALASPAVAVTATSHNAYFWKAGKCVHKCEADQARHGWDVRGLATMELMHAACFGTNKAMVPKGCTCDMACADTHTVIGLSNGTLHVIDTYGKVLQLIIRAHNSQITSLLVVNDATISNDEVIIAGVQSGEVLGYSLATGEKLWQQHTIPAAAVIGLQYEPVQHAVYALNNRCQVLQLCWQEPSGLGKQKIKHYILANVANILHSTSLLVPRYGRDCMFVAGWGFYPGCKDSMLRALDVDTDETGRRRYDDMPRVFVIGHRLFTLETSSCKNESTRKVGGSRARRPCAAPAAPPVQGAGSDSSLGLSSRAPGPLGEHMQQSNTPAAAVADGPATAAATSAFANAANVGRPGAVGVEGARTRQAAAVGAAQCSAQAAAVGAAGANADNSSMVTDNLTDWFKLGPAGPLTSISQSLQQDADLRHAILAMCMMDSGALVIGRADGMIYMFRMRSPDYG
eukprot:jgi/Chrzof1/3724/Cz13g06180.t1